MTNYRVAYATEAAERYLCYRDRRGCLTALTQALWMANELDTIRALLGACVMSHA